MGDSKVLIFCIIKKSAQPNSSSSSRSMNREIEKEPKWKRKRWGRGCVDTRIELLPRKEEMILGCRVFAVAILLLQGGGEFVFFSGSPYVSPPPLLEENKPIKMGF